MPKTKKQSVEQKRKLQKLLRQVQQEKKGANVTNNLETSLKPISNFVTSGGIRKDTSQDIQILSTDKSKASQREANKIRMQNRRKDNLYKTIENESNKKRMKEIRKSDDKYSNKERDLNLKRIRTIRQSDEEYTTKEKELNLKRIQSLRETEKETNNSRIENLHNNDTYKNPEMEIIKPTTTRETHLKNILHNVQTMSTTSYDTFSSLIKEGPTEICTCCHRLWFPRNCRFARKQFIITKYGEAFWKAVFGECYDELCLICSSCYNTIYRGKVPHLCHFNYDIVFPIPPELQSLSILEERLISPRLPFMQIRRLGYDRQCSIKGQVVNVPISVDTTVNALPRSMDDTGTIQLKLKRKIGYQQDYICETIRPGIVIKAAQYLVNQPLYKELNISVSDQWLQSVQAHNQQDKICDVLSDVSDDLEQEIDEIIKEFEQEDFFDDINPGGEQTLLDNEIVENIALAPGENRKPIHLMNDPYSEELSFPTIFCGNKKTFRVKASYSDIAKLQASHKDRRFARTDFLLYTYKKNILFHVMSKVSVAIRQKLNCNTPYTAQQVRSTELLAGLVQHDGGFNFLQSISSAPVYWQKQKRKLMSMIRQFNIPTLFFTISAAETMWPELLVILTKVIDRKTISEEEALHLPHQEKTRLIRTDPITCARYFDNRFKLLFSHMKLRDGPFKEHPIEYFYYRVEFQHRGSPHIHGLLWLKNAPICNFENADTVSQCENFIGKYITCDSGLEKTALLIPYQTHHHSKSCKRSFKEIISCRYGVPFLPMDKVTILTPLKKNKNDEISCEKFKDIKKYLNNNRDVEISMPDFLNSLSLTKDQYVEVIRKNITKPMVCLKRSVKDCFVNPFNEEILSMMKSNMDIQFILDPYACCTYIINYINKAHRGVSKLMKEAMNQIKLGNTDIKEQLLKLGNVFMNASEVSAQEAAFGVLQLHMSETSNQEVYISTLPPEKRLKVLKTNPVLDILEADDTDIYVKNLLDHYIVRPEVLEHLCLAEFAAYYNFKKYDEKAHKDKGFLECLDQSCILIKRQRPKILSFNNYGFQQDPVNFYRQQLMLYISWRDEEKELLNVHHEQLYLAKYDQIKENRKKFDLLDMTVLDEAYKTAQANLDSILVDEDLDTEMDPEYMPYGLDDPAAPDILGGDVIKTKETTEKRGFPTPFQINDDEYSQLITTLNEKQYEYLTHVLGKLQVGAKYMVSRNLNVEDGLVNGATGILRKIDKSQNGSPKVVWIEFPEDRVGKNTRKKFQTIMLLHSLPQSWTPIEKISKPIDFIKDSNVTVERKQFPLLIAEGITIHKSQGSTYTEVAVHLQKSMPRNALYVACSRATKLSGLYIFGTFPVPRKPTSSDRSNTEIANLKKNKVLKTPLRQHIEETGKITIGYQNIQSFNKHINFVKNNPLFIWSDILLFVETWVSSRDNVEIQGYQCFSNICDPNLHKPFGILCYNKASVQVKLLKEVKEVINFHTFQAVVFQVAQMTVIVVYIPPKFQIKQAANILNTILNDINGECLVLGDFNCDMSLLENNQLILALKSKGFESKLKLTSSTTNASTNIDWCFSNSMKIKSELFDTVYSFHRAISVNLYENDIPTDMDCDVSSDAPNPIMCLPRYLDTSCDDVLMSISSSSSDLDEDIANSDQGESYVHNGLQNPDGVSCYCNSSLQCLLSLPEFRLSVNKANTQINVEIKRIMLQELSYTISIRNKVADIFKERRQQDVQEFMSMLLTKLDNDFLQTINFSIANEKYCTVCDTRELGNVDENQHFYFVYFPGTEQNHISFNELIDFQQTEISCRNCSSFLRVRPRLQEVNKYLFMVFVRYRIGENGPEKIKSKITGLNLERIEIDGHVFKMKCVIKHIGLQVSSGHYIATVRQNNGKWLECNDNQLTELLYFNNDLEDVYLAVLEKID